MAGDWIKMRGGLLQSPKLIALARTLHRNREFREWMTPGGSGPMNGFIVSDHAVRCIAGSLLCVLWSWAREHGKSVTESVTCALPTHSNAAQHGDCFLSHIQLDDLDQIAGAPGIGQALATVGWAVECEEPMGVVLPKFFMEHNIPLTDAEKQRAYRDRKRYQSVTGALPREGNKTVTREEKRRVYKNSPNPSLASKEGTGCVCEISEEDQDDQPDYFDTIWAAWPAHRRKDRGRAERAWRKLDEGAVTRAEICQAALAYAQSPLGQSAACKRLQAWLAAKCWLDAPEAWQNVPFADQARASPDPAGGKIHMDEQLKAEMERAKEIRNQRTRRAARA